MNGAPRRLGPGVMERAFSLWVFGALVHEGFLGQKGSRVGVVWAASGSFDFGSAMKPQVPSLRMTNLPGGKVRGGAEAGSSGWYVEAFCAEPGSGLEGAEGEDDEGVGDGAGGAVQGVVDAIAVPGVYQQSSG